MKTWQYNLTAQVTSRGELTGQHLEVIARDTVGVSVQGIPCSTDGIINGNVSTGARTWVEVGAQGFAPDCTVATAASPAAALGVPSNPMVTQLSYAQVGVDSRTSNELMPFGVAAPNQAW